jgi:hypothetical protein
MKYSLGSIYIVKITHMEGEEIFGSCKQKTNLPPKLEGDSHRHDCVNFSHPHVNHTNVSSSVNIEEVVTDQIEEDVEVLNAPCGDGVWHIERCPFMSHVQCFVLQKSTIHSCATRIITKLISIENLAPTY